MYMYMYMYKVTGECLQVNSRYALDHQMVVIDCLDDPDDTLQRKVVYIVYNYHVHICTIYLIVHVCV